QKLKPIVKQCEIVEIPAFLQTTIAQILTSIAKQEDMHDQKLIQTIAIHAGGDLRSAINDLQLVGSTLDATLLPYRTKSTSMEQALTTIFKTTDGTLALQALDTVEEDVNQQMLWIDYNMPLEYTNVVDRVRAYGCLTKADVYQRRIMKRQ